MFEVYGEVEQAYVIIDRNSGQQKGFGYVMMKEEKIAITLASRGFVNNKGYQIKIKIHQGKSKSWKGGPKKPQHNLRKTESLNEYDYPQGFSRN
jgi:hypothetical protein